MKVVLGLLILKQLLGANKHWLKTLISLFFYLLALYQFFFFLVQVRAVMVSFRLKMYIIIYVDFEKS